MAVVCLVAALASASMEAWAAAMGVAIVVGGGEQGAIFSCQRPKPSPIHPVFSAVQQEQYHATPTSTTPILSRTI
ncbi:hypothetical protein IWX92DRAFT_365845, partial [Phyllosticta citricarpa]